MSIEINQIFKAIADPTRREIFYVLVHATASLSIHQISEHFEISRQGVTKHIKLLEQAGLITTESHGRERFCYANTKPLKQVKRWLNYYDQFKEK